MPVVGPTHPQQAIDASVVVVDPGLGEVGGVDLELARLSPEFLAAAVLAVAAKAAHAFRHAHAFNRVTGGHRRGATCAWRLRRDFSDGDPSLPPAQPCRYLPRRDAAPEASNALRTARQRWSPSCVDSNSRRVPGDSVVSVATAFSSRATLCSVQPVGIMLPA